MSTEKKESRVFGNKMTVPSLEEVMPNMTPEMKARAKAFQDKMTVHRKRIQAMTKEEYVTYHAMCQKYDSYDDTTP